MRIKKLLLILLFSTFLPASLVAASSSRDDSAATEEPRSDLDRLAKKEADRRQKLAEKGPVITNLDLDELLGEMKSRKSQVIPVDIDPDAEASDNGENPDTPSRNEDEAKAELLEDMRYDLEDSRRRVETLSNSYMVLELRLNNIRNMLFQESDPLRLQMLQKEADQVTENLMEVRAQEAEARRELESLKREALKAGLLPGEINSIVGNLPATSSSGTI